MQEALLRLEQSNRKSIHNVEAWLTTVVTRLCIDKLRSAQHRREVYPGEWLPEPVFNTPTPEQDAITRSRLSVGFCTCSKNWSRNNASSLSFAKFLNTPIDRRNRRQVGSRLPPIDGPCACCTRRSQRSPASCRNRYGLRRQSLHRRAYKRRRESYSGSLRTTQCWWVMEAAKYLRSSILCMGLIALLDSFWVCVARNAT